MRVEHDKEVDALYIYIREWGQGQKEEDFEHAETFELAGGVYVDVNKNGDALGLEVVSYKSFAEWLEQPIKRRMRTSGA